jgi:dihydroorotate dehydrogenase electron transfer subunit
MKATIKENRRLSPGYFRMSLSEVGDIAGGQPGQFVMIRGDWQTDPLLGRPLSIYRFRAEEGEVQIVYRVMGKGTHRLSEMKGGQTVDIIGPLGKPFPRPKGSQRSILVAGAIGAPPLVALAESMAARPVFILGGRTKNDVVFIRQDLEELGIEAVFVTEDGSHGATGTAVSALEKQVGTGDLVYACGPNRMLAQVARLSGEVGFEAYVSFEERMACGIGVCLGCAVRHRNGSYVHVCKDGPVFDVKDIAWDEL